MIDPLDLRSFPPVEPLSSVPETYRQTFLSKFTECPRSAFLYLKYGGGAMTHPLAGGTLLHRAVERFVKHLWENEEERGDPEVAKDILNEVLVESSDLTVSPERFDKVRAMMYHIAEGLAINPNAVIGVEVPVALEVGNKRITGTIDFAEMMSPTQCLVLDWKSAFYHVAKAPEDEEVEEYIPTKDEWEGSFQLVLYALSLAVGEIDGSPFALEGVQEFILRQVHPRTFWEREGVFAYREAIISREALLDWQLYLQALTERVAAAFEDWRWPAVIGAHCDYCPASAECPIPAPLRLLRGEIRTMEDAQRAAIEWERHKRRTGELWEAIKGFAKAERRNIRFGKDLELRWKTVTSESLVRKATVPGSTKKIKGSEALRYSVHMVAEYGVPIDLDSFWTTNTHTRLTRRTVTPAELTEEAEKGSPPDDH